MFDALTNLINRSSPGEFFPLLIPIFAVVGGLIIGMIAVSFHFLESRRKHETEASLKHEMIARGMSADEIERILAAKLEPKAPNPIARVNSKRDLAVDDKLIVWGAITLICIVPTISVYLYRWRKSELNAELKHAMIARGMSAEDIERVLGCKSEKEESDGSPGSIKVTQNWSRRTDNSVST